MEFTILMATNKEELLYAYQNCIDVPSVLGTFDTNDCKTNEDWGKAVETIGKNLVGYMKYAEETVKNLEES